MRKKRGSAGGALSLGTQAACECQYSGAPVYYHVLCERNGDGVGVLMAASGRLWPVSTGDSRPGWSVVTAWYLVQPFRPVSPLLHS